MFDVGLGMVNFTVSIPGDLYEKMKRYSEVKWSEVVRRALVEYVGRLEVVERGVVSSDVLAAVLRESGLDVGSVSLEKAVKGYEGAREAEWKRLSSTQARS
jgi:metal-responsive CopG/Arc/MetJ family transcriptional regulator